MNGWALSGSLKCNHHWQSGGASGGFNILDPTIYDGAFYDTTNGTWRSLGFHFFHSHTIGGETVPMTYGSALSSGFAAMLCTADFDPEETDEGIYVWYCAYKSRARCVRKALPDGYSGSVKVTFIESKKPEALRDYETLFLSPRGLTFVFSKDGNHNNNIEKRASYTDVNEWATAGTTYSYAVPALTDDQVSEGYVLKAVYYLNTDIYMRGSPEWDGDAICQELFGCVPTYKSYGTQEWSEGYMTETEPTVPYRWKVGVKVTI